MSRRHRHKILGWGNQPRVYVLDSGYLVQEAFMRSAERSLIERLETGGLNRAEGGAAEFDRLVRAFAGGLYDCARVINDQNWNPFIEAGIPKIWMIRFCEAIPAFLEDISAMVNGGRLASLQSSQVRASIGPVLLSMAESQSGLTSRTSSALVDKAMEQWFSNWNGEGDPLIREQMIANLDWVMESLPEQWARRARALLDAAIPWSPPYLSWFKDDDILRIDWKCGPEFLEGWIERLKREGFVPEEKNGFFEEVCFSKDFMVGGIRTLVRMRLAPERNNVFERMGDPDVHIVGYDGHSDWGRKIPRSLENAPPQDGEKCIFYLLCCGKQILAKVKGVYPNAQIVTTFNSSKFTRDFRYSEDFSAFMHILDGIVRRENWESIRDRVNGDWYHNPEKNYIFPIESILMARSLDRDHDGQADIFDRLIDFNTIDVAVDTRNELSPRVPETPPHRIVGTKLHFGVQVFHTLAHFNEILEGFTHDLRVFADGWHDPAYPPPEGVMEWGPARVRVENSPSGPLYFFSGSAHFAHATEEAWRAIAVLTLACVVMGFEEAYRRAYSPVERGLNALLMVSQGLAVDDAFGRDEALWKSVSILMGLPTALEYRSFRAECEAEHHWYAGSKAAVHRLDARLDGDVKDEIGRRTTSLFKDCELRG